jgi:hypothetical protein
LCIERYGANKQDHSGVHKSIRNRLESLSPDPIRTVFELALIILEECTGKFFDRAKSLDKQPQVIDEFSKAIGNIVSIGKPSWNLIILTGVQDA